MCRLKLKYITVRVFLCLLMLLVSWSLIADERLTIVSWGGSYAKAWEEGYFVSFEEETGVEILVEDYHGGLAQVRAQVNSDNVKWDIVDVSLQDNITGCDEGLFLPLDDLELHLGLNGEAARDDFLENALTECGIATVIGAGVVAFNTLVYEDDPPSTIDDFFDLEKYPGKRGMRRTGEVNLEWALLADGVPVNELYDVLSTDDGVDRAFRKLDSIKNSIIFWESGARPPQLLADQEVVMTSAYNGRIFNAQVMEQQPFAIVWDGHARDFAYWVIVNGAPNTKRAKEFIVESTRSQSLASISNRISYAPARRSATSLVRRHVSAGIDMNPHMPTAEGNSDRFFNINAEWWSEHRDELENRFSAWLSR